MSHTVYEDCPECHGSGIVRAMMMNGEQVEVKCFDCKGTGSVARKKVTLP